MSLTRLVELKIKVKAGAKSDKIDGWHKDAGGDTILKMSVKQIPEQGKANLAVVKFLSKQLKIPSGSIEIIRGHSCSLKTILVRLDSLETDF